MAGSDVTKSPSRSRVRRTLSLGVAFPLVLYLASTLGYVSAYSRVTFAKSAFLLQYRGGIYRYRILGTDAVLAVNYLVQHLGFNLATIPIDSLPFSSAYDLFTALVVLNGIAFVGFTVLLYVVTARNHRWVVSYLVLVALAIASAYVVTPYDDLSYLLLAALVLSGLADRPWSWPACLVLAAVGTADRESLFLGVAALAAILLSRSGAPVGIPDYEHRSAGRHDRLVASTLAAIVGSVGTYFAVRILYADPTDHASFWQTLAFKANLTPSSLIAVIMVLLGGAVLVAELPRFGDRTGTLAARYHRATLYFWILSVPYLFVTVIGGSWFEAPRLLLPLGICQYLLRWSADTPVTGGAAEGSTSPSIPSGITP